MKDVINRRNFLQKSSALAVGTAVAGSGFFNSGCSATAAGGGGLIKAACIGVFPRDISVMEKFKMAAAAGFKGIEPNTIKTPEEVAEYKKASKTAGVKIHSIMNSDHWRFPLTDNDPEVVAKSVDCIKTSMKNAKELGADAILLVPGIVTAQVGYAQVYKRSQETIRTELLPMARELNIVIAIENVGNRFLMSPLEFARYVDDFDCPHVKAYFDVGNVTRYGYPQDWIRILGERLFKIHVKKFEPGREHLPFDPEDRRTEGVDWPDVRKAMDDAGYKGWISAEVRGGTEENVKEISARMDKIFAGENPIPEDEYVKKES
jgi:L-ribulose-5-phosphate 3-epimerase